LLDAHLGGLRSGDSPVEAVVTAAERDPVEPVDHAVRTEIARRLLEGAGLTVRRLPGEVGRADPEAILGLLG
jgi:hypothetical protein